MIEIGKEINRNNKKVKLIVGDAFNPKIKKGFPDIIFLTVYYIILMMLKDY